MAADTLVPGEIAVVMQDWTYDCPRCPEVITVHAGDQFRVHAYISAKHSDSGFAFYRGTVVEKGKEKEYLCPVDKCERVQWGQ